MAKPNKRVASVDDLEFDAGMTSQTFTLGDGHKYLVHQFQAEGGGEPQYKLRDLDRSMSVTPYVNRALMDRVLALRAEQGEGKGKASGEPSSWLW